MTFIKYLTFTILTISIISCDNKNSKLSALKIITNAKNQKISNSSTLELKISNPNTIAIDSVIYTLNNKGIDSVENLKNYKLGEYSITAKIYTSNNIYTK